jgi:hypothetical protein
MECGEKTDDSYGPDKKNVSNSLATFKVARAFET